MHTYARKLIAHADDVSRLTGYSRPNGTGLVGIIQHRDSDCLDQSNFATAVATLTEIDDRTNVVSFGHWAVGWVEEISVPLTDAICDAVESMVDALSDYPVLDDADYSERETEDLRETLINCYDVSSMLVNDVMTTLFEDHSVCRSEDLRSDDVATVVRQLVFTLTSDSRLSEEDTIRLATDLLDEIGLSVVLVDREHDASTALIRDQLVNRGLRPLSVAGTPDDGVVVVLDYNDARSLLDD
jgi:hypothetical protein